MRAQEQASCARFSTSEPGFEGSYDAVAAFARQWRVDRLERGQFCKERDSKGFAGKAKRPV